MREVCRWRAGLALVALAAAPQAGAERRWTEVRSPHFVVVSDGGEGRARRVAARIEQIRAAFGSMAPDLRLDAEEPITVLAAKDAGGAEELIPDLVARKDGARPAGMFVSGWLGRYVALLPVRGEEDYSVVYHEYVHFLLDLNFEALPVWAAEGIAELYAHSEVRDDQVIVGRPAPAHLRLLQSQTPLPFEVLVEVDHGSPHYEERDKASLFYAQSWATIHYLLMSGRGAERPRFARYLELVGEGVPGADAARRGLGDLDALRRAIESYAHRDRLFNQQLSAELHAGKDRFPARGLDAAEADALIGDFLFQRGQLALARERLEKALAARPALARGLTSLAALEWREGRTEEARARVAAAIAADPDSHLAHFLSGQLLLEAGDPGSVAAARAAMERSLELNPDFAHAHSALATLLIAAGEVEAAARHAGRSVELEPGRPQYRAALAIALARLGVPNQAEAQARLALIGTRTEPDREELARHIREASGYRLTPDASGDVDPERRDLEVACAAGDTDRCVELADAYWAGERGGRDGRGAVALLVEPCDAGAPEACARLAEYHCDDPVATTLENAPGWGCYQLAVYAQRGEGVPQDAARTAELFRRACDAGFLSGCAGLGQAYENGTGVEADPARAAELYRRSCEASDAWACTALGLLLSEGRGVERDPPQAEQLLAGACDAGEGWACANLGNLLEFAPGFPRDRRRAHTAYDRACALDFAPGCERRSAIEARFPDLARDEKP